MYLKKNSKSWKNCLQNVKIRLAYNEKNVNLLESTEKWSNTDE